MTFPAVPLPTVTELLIDGAWTDVTSDVREETGVVISRGRPNETTRTNPSALNLALDNRSAAYSNRMPTALYYGKLGRNTQLRHRIRWVYDTMDRNVANTWGSTTTGQAWTNAGTASDYFGDGVRMFHKHTNRGTFRSSTVSLPIGTADVTATFSAPTPVTGGAIYFETVLGTDLSNHYVVTATFTAAGTVTVGLGERVGGSLSSIGATVTVGSTGVLWSVRLQRTAGGYLRAKAWPSASAQPTAWTLAETTPDTTLSTFTMAGVRSLLDGANTNTLDVFLAFWDFEVANWRFWGEVPLWPQTWDTTGRDITVPIEAAGIMRRLGGSARPLRSALTRAMLGVSEGDFQPIAHWSAEDGSGATQLGSSFSGQPAATVAGSVSLASYSGFAGSQPLPILNVGYINALMPSYTDTGIWQMQFTMMIPSSGFSNNADMVIIEMAPGKPTATVYLTYIQSSGELRLSAFDAAGTSLASGDTVGNAWQRDTAYLCAISDVVSAGTHFLLFSMYLPNGNNLLTLNIQPDGIGAGTAGVPRRLRAVGTSVSSGWSFGQLALYTANILSAPNIGPNAQAAGGYTGETATDRMIRLCREERVYLELIGDTADTAPLGPQRPGKLLDLLFECADADQGILYEPRDALGLAYRTRPSLYNQTGLTLNYTARQVHPPFAPVEDDQILVNDATAHRVDGSFGRATVDSGPLSTQDPPNGAGVYAEDRTYNVATDEQLEPLAGWRVHVGSWDEARYPQIHVMLNARGFTASPTLTGQVAAVDVGDYLAVTNPPAWLPPGLIELLAQGYRETHHNYEWDITFNCVPAGPYAVGVYDSARYDSDDTTTSGSLTTTATSVGYTVTAGKVGWVTTAANPAEFPFDILIGGERMTVTAATSTTFTVTRSVNGVVKAHSTGAAVHVANSGYYAL